MDELTRGLAATVVLGVACQWAADRFRLPSILPLLIAGIIAGPATGLIEPDRLFGDLLFPAVSLGVAVLLFEGGLGLQFRTLREGRGPVLRLVTIGVGVTWVVGVLAIKLLFDVSNELAAVLAAVLVVSGPTVVIPILQTIRIREPTTSILRWEGIFVDPIGAVFAVAVFSAVFEGQSGALDSALNVALTAIAGGAAGAAGAALLVFVFERHLVADRLHNPVTLMTVLAAFTVANFARPEAGLFAATVAGVVLANQRRVPLRHVAEFEENLGTLIAAGLFVVLGARLKFEELTQFAVPALALACLLILVGRPLAAWASTIGSPLPTRDRAFLASMAPRGIVAAAVSSLFAIELEEQGIDAEPLVPVTFAVIFVTVAVYGLLARPMAKALRVASPIPRGLALVGGAPWVLDLAERLLDEEVPVLVVTPDPEEARAALARGVLVYDGKLEGEDFTEAVDSVGIGQALVLSGRPALDTLAVSTFSELLGRANTYQLPAAGGSTTGGAHSRSHGRRAFPDGVSLESIVERIERGARVTTMGTRQPIDVDPSSGTVPLVVLDGNRPPLVVTPTTVRIPADRRVAVLGPS